MDQNAKTRQADNPPKVADDVPEDANDESPQSQDDGFQPLMFFRRWTLNKKKRRTNDAVKPTMVQGTAEETDAEETEADIVRKELKMGVAILVDFPFELDLEHDPIELDTMFKATLAFDEHEVDPEKFGTGAATGLIVDVVSVGRTETTLRITPSKGLNYATMADELDELIKRVSKNVFGGHLHAKQLRWYLREYGVSSDQRRNYSRIT